MAIASPKSLYTLSTLSFLICFLLSLLIFSRRTLEPKLSIYRDLFYETPLLSSFLSPRPSSAALPRSREGLIGPNASIQTPIYTDEFDGKKTDAFSAVEAKEKEYPVPSDKNPLHGTPLLSSLLSTPPRSNALPHYREDINGPNTFIPTPTLPYETCSGIVEKGKKCSDSSDKDSSISALVDVNESMGRLKLMKNCNLYVGTWVKDEDYPLYEPGSCPYVDEAYDCQNNGRRDSEYLKWRWKPDACELPRFNATDFLVRLRGKRLMLVGDSMNRNQFESILCLLRKGLSDKNKMYEIQGHKITKGRGYYFFKFEDYNCSVEFVRSHFLVKEGVRIGGRGNSNPTLSIDRIDKTAGRWKKADILIFNTGHWWTHGKTARGKNYYKEGDYIYPQFDAVEAFRRALKTWANWIDTNIKPGKFVFYRGYSSAHFRGGDWDSGGTCNGETEPILSGSFINNYPLKMKIVEEVIQEMQFPVVLLNVTRLTNFRKDGHPSIYGKNITDGRKVSSKRQDCSHWCLPGVPDSWNELIYATLLIKQTSSGNLQ